MIDSYNSLKRAMQKLQTSNWIFLNIGFDRKIKQLYSREYGIAQLT